MHAGFQLSARRPRQLAPQGAAVAGEEPPWQSSVAGCAQVASAARAHRALKSPPLAHPPHSPPALSRLPVRSPWAALQEHRAASLVRSSHTLSAFFHTSVAVLWVPSVLSLGVLKEREREFLVGLVRFGVFGQWMAATQVATQVTTKRLFNIMSSGQSLMRSVYYSRQTSTKFLWQKQKEIFSMVGSVSRRWSSSSSVAEGATSNTDDSSSPGVAPPAVDADTRSYGSVQENPHEVASSSHEDHDNRSDDQEKLSDTGYDMSKVSKPAGDE